jgi:RNA polymerase sigma factor (sigma-70 family)
MTRRIPPELQAALARMFADHVEAVFPAVLLAAYGDRAAAQDALQEAIEVAAHQWGKISDYPPADKRNWLRTVAIRKTIDAYRKGWKRTQPMNLEDLRLESQSAEQVALTQLQVDGCLKVIREMPEMRRKVAYLRFHEEWTNKAIATHLGIRPGTVGKHVYEARADLKRALPEMTFVDDHGGEADADGEETL